MISPAASVANPHSAWPRVASPTIEAAKYGAYTNVVIRVKNGWTAHSNRIQPAIASREAGGGRGFIGESYRLSHAHLQAQDYLHLLRASRNRLPPLEKGRDGVGISTPPPPPPRRPPPFPGGAARTTAQPVHTTVSPQPPRACPADRHPST